MAKIGNEATLILKLAKERVGSAKRLQEEISFRGQPGCHPEQFGWQNALEIGYFLGINVYQDAINGVVSEITER